MRRLIFFCWKCNKKFFNVFLRNIQLEALLYLFLTQTIKIYVFKNSQVERFLLTYMGFFIFEEKTPFFQNNLQVLPIKIKTFENIDFFNFFLAASLMFLINSAYK